MNTHVPPPLPGDPLTPDEREKRKLAFAIKLAKDGMYIAPLQPNSKLPYLGESWLNMRTRDEVTIRKWFKERPGMNYAVSPGEDFVVLDLDTKKGKDGIRDLDALATEALEFMDATLTVKTPTGGQHRYFSTGGVPYSVRHTLPKSIDVRGMDGYVVGPGCWTEHNAVTGTVEGSYEIAKQVNIAPLPSWIEPYLTRWVPREERQSYEDAFETDDEGNKFVTRNDGVKIQIDTPSSVGGAMMWLAHTAKPAIEYEGGNETTYKTFAWLREHNISGERALDLVAEHYNPRACRRVKPGEDKFVPAPWEYQDLERLRDNAFKYAKRENSLANVLTTQFQSEQEIVEGMQNVTLPAESAVAIAEAVEGGVPSEEKTTRESLRKHTYRGPAALEYPAKREFVIPRVLPAYGYVGFLARRGTGKTTVLADMALRLAHDMDWHGQPMKHGWGAIFLAGEDPEGVQDQIEAWLKFHGLSKNQLSDRFVFMDAIPDLTKPVETWEDHLRGVTPDRRFALFADTWQVATASSSQNEDDKMQIAIRNLKALAKIVRGPGIVAAHPPKGNEDTWSGSAVLENGSQALWKLTKETFGLKFSVPRIKGARADFYRLFEFKTQMLGGVNEWGQPNTGIVPVANGGEGLVPKQDALTHEDRVKQAVTDAAYGILIETDEQRGDDGKTMVWSGRKMSEDIAKRNDDPASPVVLPCGPIKADTLARSFSGWYENKIVEATRRGPGGIRLGVTMTRAKGNAWVFKVVEVKEKPPVEQTIPADE